MSRLVTALRRRIAHTVYPQGRRKVLHRQADGLELLVLANEDVGRELYAAGRYEADELACLKRLVRPDDVCFDVGSNVGYFSLQLASIAKAGTVHAFDPIALNAALVQASAALNGMRNVEVTCAALGSEPGSAQFSVSADSAYSSLRATGRKLEESTVEVPVLTLDGYVAEHAVPRVNVMKIDVEGAEAEVLQGGRALFADRRRRPRVVLIELYDPNFVAFGTSSAAIMQSLLGLGYGAHVPDGTALRAVAAPLDDCYNYFFVDPAR